MEAHFTQSFCVPTLCPHLYLYILHSILETEVRSALKGKRAEGEKVRSRIDSDCEAPVSALIRECAVLTK